MTDLTSLTLAEARDQLASRAISSVEITTAHLEAIVRAKALNAYIVTTPGRALQMAEASDATSKNTGMLLTLALNYSARSEIVDAFRSLAEAAARNGGLDHFAVDEQAINEHLYTRGMPDPDLVIRTSGEMRLSNFLLWQLAYAEIYVTQTLWPDFRGVQLLEGIEEYQKRDRRYGGLGPDNGHAKKHVEAKR